MRMTAEAAVLCESANTSTSLDNETKIRMHREFS
jgi:hypothetical protein